MENNRFEAFIKAKREKREKLKAKDRKAALRVYLDAKKPSPKPAPLPKKVKKTKKPEEVEEWRFLDE